MLVGSNKHWKQYSSKISTIFVSNFRFTTMEVQQVIRKWKHRNSIDRRTSNLVLLRMKPMKSLKRGETNSKLEWSSVFTVIKKKRLVAVRKEFLNLSVCAEIVLWSVGFSKNRAVEHSTGRFLCFQDAVSRWNLLANASRSFQDDLMLPERIQRQFRAALEHNEEKLLSKTTFSLIELLTRCLMILISRIEVSTDSWRFDRSIYAVGEWDDWRSTLHSSNESRKLIDRFPDVFFFFYRKIYLAHGPTLIMPTWFCSRSWFDFLGGFDEIAQVNVSSHISRLIYFLRILFLGSLWRFNVFLSSSPTR